MRAATLGPANPRGILYYCSCDERINQLTLGRFPETILRTPFTGVRAALPFGRSTFASPVRDRNSPSVESRYRLNWLIASGESRRRQTRVSLGVFTGVRRAYDRRVRLSRKARTLLGQQVPSSGAIPLFTSISHPSKHDRQTYIFFPLSGLPFHFVLR